MKRIAMLLGLGMLAACGNDPAKPASEPPPATPFPMMRPTANDPTRAALPRWDANRDGVLDPQERAAIRERVRADLAPQSGEVLERWDLDGNGKLDAFEIDALRRDQKLREAKAHAVALRRYDRNGNGVIDPDERAEMRRNNAAFLQRAQADVLRAYDLNRNGVLDPDEQARLEADVLARKRQALEQERARNAPGP